MKRVHNISHPYVFDVTKGNTKVITDIAAINQSIELILKTAKGELYGDPNFGSRLYALLFQQMDAALEDTIKTEIVQCLSEQEPRISVDTDGVIVNHNRLTKTTEIRIRYKLVNSDYLSNYSMLVNNSQ